MAHVGIILLIYIYFNGYFFYSISNKTRRGLPPDIPTLVSKYIANNNKGNRYTSYNY